MLSHHHHWKSGEVMGGGWIGPEISCEIAVEGKLDGSGTGQNFLAKDHKNKKNMVEGG